MVGRSAQSVKPSPRPAELVAVAMTSLWHDDDDDSCCSESDAIEVSLAMCESGVQPDTLDWSDVIPTRSEPAAPMMATTPTVSDGEFSDADDGDDIPFPALALLAPAADTYVDPPSTQPGSPAVAARGPPAAPGSPTSTPGSQPGEVSESTVTVAVPSPAAGLPAPGSPASGKWGSESPTSETTAGPTPSPAAPGSSTSLSELASGPGSPAPPGPRPGETQISTAAVLGSAAPGPPVDDSIPQGCTRTWQGRLPPNCPIKRRAFYQKQAAERAKGVKNLHVKKGKALKAKEAKAKKEAKGAKGAKGAKKHKPATVKAQTDKDDARRQHLNVYNDFIRAKKADLDAKFPSFSINELRDLAAIEWQTFKATREMSGPVAD